MRLIDADALKKTIINICGNCSNIIREYKDGVPDGNCAIQHIMNMIDNAPTVEYPFYAERGRRMTKEELIEQMEKLKNDLLEDLAKCNAKHDVLVTQIAELNSLIAKAKE